MKKYLFILISVIFICCSCDVTPIKRDDKAHVGSTKYNEYIELNECRYYKVKIGEHNCYQYTFRAYWGIGSDVIHFEDMCEYCKNKNK